MPSMPRFHHGSVVHVFSGSRRKTGACLNQTRLVYYHVITSGRRSDLIDELVHPSDHQHAQILLQQGPQCPIYHVQKHYP
jgi:hypothetical protein